MSINKSYSFEMQDLATLKLFGKSGKTFLDIGCGHPLKGNNTLLLEENGWKGICVDISDFSKEYTKERSSTFYQVDATTDEFINIVRENYPSGHIDYISLDTNAPSLEILEKLLMNGYKFKFMTFEHDYHWVRSYKWAQRRDPKVEWNGYGTVSEMELRKYKSRDILHKRGYSLLFEDVSFYEKNTGDILHPWEDWWFDPSVCGHDFLVRLHELASKNIHFGDCVKRILTLGN